MRNTRKLFRGVDEVVDLELNCKNCGTRLYAPVQVARQAVATVQNGGIAVLICPYAHIQSIRQRRRRTHD